MNTSKRVFGSFFALVAVLGTCAITGCAAESTEEFGETEGAIGAKAPAATVRIDVIVAKRDLAYRRVLKSLDLGTPMFGTTPQYSLPISTGLTDWGRLTVPTIDADRTQSTGIYWKLQNTKALGSWSNLATAQSAVQTILNKLNAASGNGCKDNDWHLATFKDPDGADFVCATLADGTPTLIAPGTLPTSTSNEVFDCDITSGVTWASSNGGDKLTITFTRKNNTDETIDGYWFANDGKSWQGVNSEQCPDSTCLTPATKVTSSSPKATFYLTGVADRKVKFYANKNGDPWNTCTFLQP